MLIVSTCIYVSFFSFLSFELPETPPDVFPLLALVSSGFPSLLRASTAPHRTFLALFFFPARSARAVSAISLVRLPAPPFSTVLDPLSRLSASLSGQRLARPSLRLVPDHIVSFSASQRGVASTISLVSAPLFRLRF